MDHPELGAAHCRRAFLYHVRPGAVQPGRAAAFEGREFPLCPGGFRKAGRHGAIASGESGDGASGGIPAQSGGGAGVSGHPGALFLLRRKTVSGTDRPIGGGPALYLPGIFHRSSGLYVEQGGRDSGPQGEAGSGRAGHLRRHGLRGAGAPRFCGHAGGKGHSRLQFQPAEQDLFLPGSTTGITGKSASSTATWALPAASTWPTSTSTRCAGSDTGRTPR